MSEQVITRGFSAVIDELRQRYGWKLHEELGRGGFAIVYREEVDGIPRAVKISLDSFHDDTPSVSRQFEALQLLLSIGNHPHLLTLIRYEIVLDHLVTVWELAEEGTLGDLLEIYQQMGMPGLPVDELLEYMEQAAEGIDFLNTRGIYHRDIKPQNLFLIGGKVKVGDLGLLKLAGLSMVSHTGAGTRGYLPPEAYGSLEQPGQVHRSIDVYGLAATYVHLRTGKPPFGTSPSEIYERQSRGEPVADGLTPAELDWLRRALSPIPEERPLSASVFFEELTRRLTMQPPEVQPVEEIPVVEPVPPLDEPVQLLITPRRYHREAGMPPLPSGLRTLQERYLAVEAAIQQVKRGTHPDLLAASESLRKAQQRAEQLRSRLEQAPLPEGVTPKIRDIIWQRMLHNPDQPPSAYLGLLPHLTTSWELVQWLAQVKQAAEAARPVASAERQWHITKARLLQNLRLQQAELRHHLEHAQRYDLLQILQNYRRRFGQETRALPLELWSQLGPKLQARYVGWDTEKLLHYAEQAWEESNPRRWRKRSWFALAGLAAYLGGICGIMANSPELGPEPCLGGGLFGGILGMTVVGLIYALHKAHSALPIANGKASGPPIANRRAANRRPFD